MPKVVKEEIDKLNAKLQITLEKADYETLFNKELAKYRKQAHMKGFRKGKTPMSVVKKMYGKAVLGDVINQTLQQELINFIDSEKNLLGHPISSKDQELIEFDWKEMDDYSFHFDLGLAPEFEIQGLEDDHVFTNYKVQVTEEMIDEDLANARKRLGERFDAEEDIEENDLITLEIKELDGKKKIKEEGLTSEFSVLVKDVEDKKLQKKILGKKKGDDLPIPLVGLEKSADEDFVKKNYLRNPDLEGAIPALFQATIQNVSRVKEAEMTEDFFKQFFGSEDIKDEEGARAKIKEDTEAFFNKQSEALLFRELQDHLMAQNSLELPDEFLKRWLLATNEKLNEKSLSKEYPLFAENLKWTLIKNKLAKNKEVTIEEEDLRNAFRERIKGYFASSPYGSDPSIVENMVDRMMQDQKQIEQIQEEVLSDKLFDSVVPDLTKEEKEISLKEFEEIAQKARAEAMAASSVEEEE